MSLPLRTAQPSVVYANAAGFEFARDSFQITVYGVLGSILLFLVVRRFVTASSSRRRRSPMLLAGGALAVWALIEAGLTFSSYSEAVREALFCRSSWCSRPCSSRCLSDSFAVASPTRLSPTRCRSLSKPARKKCRAPLARALGEPSLEVVYWLATRAVRRRARTTGATSGPRPNAGCACSSTTADASVRSSTTVHSTTSPASSTPPPRPRDSRLENARLQAELRAQLEAVRGSRARLAAAADAERRRIEQNLHDGAQQRLVALALDLRAAERRLAVDPDENVAPVLGRCR